ncbi:MAG: TIGR01777 family oxidoreductase [Brumimicrobium sp.]
MSENYTILIAGGTGMIGKELTSLLKKQGHNVRILTRDAQGRDGYYNWSPSNKTIEEAALEGVDIIINLAGAGIADKRWTPKRKKVLIDSRVNTTQFLFELSDKIPSLTQYISASGINCYDYNQYNEIYKEEDAFSDDFLSTLVEKWENTADLFQEKCKVAKVRTSVVLSNKGGALPTMAKTVKYYLGAPLGKGSQWLPWVSLEDVVSVYAHLVNNQVEGVYNTLAGAVTNKAFTKQLAKTLNKPLWLPKVPSFLLKLILGEMSVVVLEGVQADNSKLLSTGFRFKNKNLKQTLESIYN